MPSYTFEKLSLNLVEVTKIFRIFPNVQHNAYQMIYIVSIMMDANMATSKGM